MCWKYILYLLEMESQFPSIWLTYLAHVIWRNRHSNKIVRDFEEVELCVVQFMGELNYIMVCLTNIVQIQWQGRISNNTCLFVVNVMIPSVKATSAWLCRVTVRARFYSFLANEVIRCQDSAIGSITLETSWLIYALTNARWVCMLHCMVQ